MYCLVYSLFQGLPIPLNRKLFLDLNKMVIAFIWQRKRARLPYRLLICPRSRGGLTLPDFQSYYRAAQLRVIKEWSLRDSTKHWLHMEHQLTGRTIWDLPWKAKPHRPANSYISTPISTTLRTWDILTTKLRLTTFPSPYTPIHYNEAFPPALHRGPFEIWREEGCHTISHLYQGRTLLSFQECQQQFSLPSTEHFRYLQLKHWVTQPLVRRAATRDLLPIEKFAQSGAGSKGCISFLYELIQSLSPHNTPRHRTFWDALLDTIPNGKQWECLHGDIRKFNRSMHLREAHYKTLYDWYLYPQKLHRIFPTTSDRCWRGCGHLGNFRHIWWDCPQIQPFWKEILSHIKLILGYPIPRTLAHTLLGIGDPLLKHQTRSDREVMWLCLGAAKMALAAAWKQPEAPSLTQWHARMWRALACERMAAILEDTRKEFDITWAPLISYLSTGLPLTACAPRIRALNMFLI